MSITHAGLPLGPVNPSYPWPPHANHIGPTGPAAMLTVSDVERLAKAGVQVKMEDIIDHVCQDPPQMVVKEYGSDVETPGPARPESTELMKAIWYRLRVNTKAMQNDYTDRGMYRMMPVQAAVRHGDTIHVFVHTGHSAPCIIEDEAVLFPSDALMAKIALLEKVEKSRYDLNEGNVNTAPQAAAANYPPGKATPVPSTGQPPTRGFLAR